MKCQNCGADIREGVKFCPKCGSQAEAVKKEAPIEFISEPNIPSMSGTYVDRPNSIMPSAPVVNDSFAPSTPVVVNEPDKKPKKKVKKGKIIAISVLTLILALAITLVVLFFTSPAYSVYKDLTDGKISSATSTYNRDVDDNFIQEKILEILLDGRVDEVVADYNAGSLSYEKAVEELEALEKMGFEGVKDKIKLVTASNDSSNAFKKAEEYYNSGDFVNAIAEYSKITSDSEDYQEAQKKLDEICPKYIESVVDKAEEYNSNEQYKEAITYIDTAYGILPDDVDTSDLDTLRSTSYMNYQTQVSTSVANLMDEEKYSEAFALIDEAIKFDNNECFTNLKTTTEETYVSTITETVNNYIKNFEYKKAANAVDAALNLLPNNEELEALKKTVEDNTPTKLSDVHLIDSNDYYSYSADAFTDSFGNVYDGYHWFNTNGCYAVYNLDGMYDTFNCSVVASASTDANKVYTVYIYLDDELAYTLTDFKKTTGKKDISIDVSNVKKMEIKTEGNSGHNYNINIVVLTNAFLSSNTD